MNTVTLAGWGQPHDALAAFGPGIDYAHASSATEALRMVAAQAKDAERIVGWSLGGQLAVRAIAEGMISPKQLVLIAVPYQFVADDAMGRETFAKFYSSYKSNPARTLHKAWELLHYEDDRADYIRDQMASFSKDAVLAKDWLRWLGILEHYNCDALDFSRFPRTLLVHGERDKVVEPSQSKRMAARMPQATLEIWQGCGHAPHWHDRERLTQAIAQHAAG